MCRSQKATSMAKRMPIVCTQFAGRRTSTPVSESRPRSPLVRSRRELAISTGARNCPPRRRTVMRRTVLLRLLTAAQ